MTPMAFRKLSAFLLQRVAILRMFLSLLMHCSTRLRIRYRKLPTTMHLQNQCIGITGRIRTLHLVVLIPHHHFDVLHLVRSRRGQNAGCRYSCFFVSIAETARAALLAIAVVASRNGLSAMIFAVHRPAFSGERFAITARVAIPTANSLRMQRSPCFVILPMAIMNTP